MRHVVVNFSGEVNPGRASGTLLDVGAPVNG